MPKGGKSEGQSESEDEARASKKGGDHAVGKRNKRKASIKLPTPDMNEAEKRSLKAGGTPKKKGEGKRGSTSSSGEDSQELDADEKKRFHKYFRSLMMEKKGAKTGRKRGTERHSKGSKSRRDASSDERGGSGESTSEGEEEPKPQKSGKRGRQKSVSKTTQENGLLRCVMSCHRGIDREAARLTLPPAGP